MEEFFSYVCAHAHYAPWILFTLLLLTGLFIPISEDLILLSGGALASTCISEHTVSFYFILFFGSLLAAWEAYWMGRLLGEHLYRIPYLKSVVTPSRLDRLRHYYAKFGVFTFIIGRFCPGGVRNALFISSGLTRMPFITFILRDGVACLISTIIIFSIGYKFGQHFDLILFYFNRYTHIFFILFICLALTVLFYLLRHWKRSSNSR